MLSKEDLEQLDALAAKFEAANADAVRAIVQNRFHPVFQAINDGGRAAANQSAKEKIEAAENKAKELQKQLDDKVAELKTLSEKTPEIAAVRREYEQKIVELTNQHKTAVEQLNGAVRKSNLDRALVDLSRILVSDEFKLDPEYVNTVVINRDDLVKRIRISESGAVSILQEGQQELTITPAANRTALHHLAEEVAKKTPDKWKVSSVASRGPNTTGQPNASSSGENKFDKIRAAEKERGSAMQKKNQRPGLARMRGESVSAAE